MSAWRPRLAGALDLIYRAFANTKTEAAMYWLGLAVSRAVSSAPPVPLWESAAVAFAGWGVAAALLVLRALMWARRVRQAVAVQTRVLQGIMQGLAQPKQVVREDKKDGPN